MAVFEFCCKTRCELFGQGSVIGVLPRARVGRFDPKRSFRPTNENSAFDGVISCCNPDGTFNINFDDGEKNTSVNGELIQMHARAKRGNRFEVGDRVKAKQKLEIGGNRRWLQPALWNQGSHTAVYFDVDKQEVVFVEVAQSESHAFKMTHLNEVLLKLKAAGMHISNVVVYIVIKPTQCVWDFNFSSIED